MISRRTFLALASGTAIGVGVSNTSPDVATGKSVRATSVLVYGATPSGIMAAIAAKRSGADVQLLLGESPLGGMLTNGLSITDRKGHAQIIGGLALAFYQALGRHYGQTVAWTYEPHVALQVLRTMLSDYDIVPKPGVLAGAVRDGATITAIRTTDGAVHRARVFVDASYEAVLSAAVATTVFGRESVATYGESGAGFGQSIKSYRFHAGTTAYRAIPGLTPKPVTPIGSGDDKIMCFTYRLCLTEDPDRIPFAAPRGYDADRYATLADPSARFRFRLYPLPNHKFDMNGGDNLLDTNFVGGNVGFCTATRGQRLHIARAHHNYQAGLLHFLATDRRVPTVTRDRAAALGLAPDEFGASGHWPQQLYIREARRLVGDYVMRQSDITTDVVKPDSIGMSSYLADSHAVQRYIGAPGVVRVEGAIPDRLVPVRPYQIPYRALLPKRAEVSNLISALPLSVSRVVWTSIRTEPQLMIAGEAAGTAAAVSVTTGTPLASVGGTHFTSLLRSHNAITALGPSDSIGVAESLAIAAGAGAGAVSITAVVRSAVRRHPSAPEDDASG